MYHYKSRKIFITFAAVKQIMRDILFIMVAILYVVSTMGYGVHKCNAEGSASLILLFGETPCEYVHSHTDSNGNTYTHSHPPHSHSCSHGCTHLPDSNSCSHGCTHHHNDAEHHHGGEHHAQEHSHEDCCSTSVYVLTHDQNTNDHSQWYVPQPQLLAELVWNDSLCSLFSPYQQAGLIGEYGSWSVPSNLAEQAQLCTFRI